MATLPQDSVASDWSQFKGGPSRTGLADASSENPGGLRWSFEDPVPWEESNGLPTPCAIAANGTIYFGNGENSNSGHGCLVALSPNGTMRWK